MSEQDVLILTVAVIGCAVVFLAGLLLVRGFRTGGNAAASGMPSFSDMVIHFQTLRDLVHEQKLLAHEFNVSFDKKVSAVRDVIRAFSDERERLASAQTELRQLIEEARSELANLRTGGASAPVSLSEALVAAVSAAPVSPEPDVVEDIIDGWVGADFVSADEQTPEEAAPEPVEPEPPQVRAQSHEAMDALLRMGEAARAGGTIHPFPDMDEPRDRLSSVRARAYKFYDSGMSVAQIAKELGMGKGEVRLMLNLREKAE